MSEGQETSSVPNLDVVTSISRQYIIPSILDQISQSQTFPLLGAEVGTRRPPSQGPANPRITLGDGFSFGLSEFGRGWIAECPGWESESVQLYREDVDELIDFLTTWRDIIPSRVPPLREHR